ncbi:hypothetical protein C7271_16790 [filamentous cyanobacterium CCP5]|nr:hypothetical protein C7271_16790 [filamentous cyanobacterium CCP5]
MANFGLTPYYIRVKKVNTRKDSKEYIRLGGKFNENAFDLVSILKSYFEDFLSKSEVEKKKFLGQAIDKGADEIIVEKKLLCGAIHQDDDILKGILHFGETGPSANITNVHTNKINYKTEPDTDANTFPYYFAMKLRPEADAGILLLQTIKNRGIKTSFEEDFSKYFKCICPEYRISFPKLVPKKIVEEYMSKSVKKIRFIDFRFPKRAIDARTDGLPSENKTSDVKFELKMSPSTRGGVLTKDITEPLLKNIQKLLEPDRQISVADVYEVQNMPGSTYENIKIDIDFDGKLRTINLQDFDALKYNIEVDEEIDYGADKNPTFNSIDSVGMRFLSKCSDVVYGKSGG